MPSPATSCRKTTIVATVFTGVLDPHGGGVFGPSKRFASGRASLGACIGGQERLQSAGKNASSSRDCPLNYEALSAPLVEAGESPVPPHQTVPDSCDDDTMVGGNF